MGKRVSISPHRAHIHFGYYGPKQKFCPRGLYLRTLYTCTLVWFSDIPWNSQFSPSLLDCSDYGYSTPDKLIDRIQDLLSEKLHVVRKSRVPEVWGFKNSIFSGLYTLSLFCLEWLYFNSTLRFSQLTIFLMNTIYNYKFQAMRMTILSAINMKHTFK